jgi:hypothetical protein
LDGVLLAAFRRDRTSDGADSVRHSGKAGGCAGQAALTSVWTGDEWRRQTEFVPIRRDSAGQITGWFLYDDDPELATLSNADRERWPHLTELADREASLEDQRPQGDGPRGKPE